MLRPMLDGPVATIDLEALAFNLARVRAAAPSAGLLVAIKANAYGHGAETVAPFLEARGVSWFGVATPTEAFALRDAGVAAGILLFSPVHDATLLQRLVDAGVSLTVTDLGSLDALRAAKVPGTARVHLKVDTGMGRLGRPWQETLGLARFIGRMRDAQLEGVWTHFARSDEADAAPTDAQLEAFDAALDALSADGIEPGLRHAANSAAIFLYPRSHYDLVRPGIALYGFHSSDVVAARVKDLRPVMRLEAPVTFVKRVAAGDTVSYGGQWRSHGATTIATVRVGYADGYPRQLSGRGWASLHGVTVPVAGRVCMDQLMLDAGDLDVSPGDTVTLWGGRGPDPEELARAALSISYELFTRLSHRVERRYEGNDA